VPLEEDLLGRFDDSLKEIVSACIKNENFDEAEEFFMSSISHEEQKSSYIVVISNEYDLNILNLEFLSRFNNKNLKEADGCNEKAKDDIKENTANELLEKIKPGAVEDSSSKEVPFSNANAYLPKNSVEAKVLNNVEIIKESENEKSKTNSYNINKPI
jgi:hypothetical protein